MKKLFISLFGLLISGYSISQLDVNSASERTLSELKGRFSSAEQLEQCYAKIVELEKEGISVLSSTDWINHMKELENLQRKYSVTTLSNREGIAQSIQFIEQHEISIDSFLSNYFK